jgi:hypothetical protein
MGFIVRKVEADSGLSVYGDIFGVVIHIVGNRMTRSLYVSVSQLKTVDMLFLTLVSGASKYRYVYTKENKEKIDEIDVKRGYSCTNNVDLVV